MCAVSFSNQAGIPSGPWALWPCRFTKSLATPSTWISSTTIVLKGEIPKSGRVEVFSLVKTDVNCWLNSSALSWASLTVIPFTSREGMETWSRLLLFT